MTTEEQLREALEGLLDVFTNPESGEVDRKLAIKDARAALASKPGEVAVPNGWRLVPVQPTPEMVRAAQNCPEGHGQKWHSVHKAKWAAMLAAAPTPQPQAHADARPWLPIETAPKDGTAILLWEQYSICPFVGFWCGGRWTVSKEHVDAEGGWDGAVVVDRLQMPITHWAKLPDNEPTTLAAIDAARQQQEGV